jgi:hypothetical protein
MHAAIFFPWRLPKLPVRTRENATGRGRRCSEAQDDEEAPPGHSCVSISENATMIPEILKVEAIFRTTLKDDAEAPQPGARSRAGVGGLQVLHEGRLFLGKLHLGDKRNS